MVISRSPLRLSFFGGGTDYPEYYLRKPGAVLGATIDKYIFVTINKGSPFFEHRVRVNYSKSETVNQIEEIEHQSVREVLTRVGLDEHLDIHIFADLPARTGLGSSSAFTVCFLNACYAHQGKYVHKRRLAEESVAVEHDVLKENVGIQDQFHSAFGGMNVLRPSAQGISVNPVVIAEEKRSLIEDSLMLFYTRMTRSATAVLDEQVEKTRKLTVDKQLDRMAEQVDEAQTMLADLKGAALLRKFGDLLHEGWTLKKQLSTKITNVAIDHYYAEALKHGALGGKIGGAGAGGFLMLLVEKKRQEEVRKALRDLAEVDFKFENNGASIIYSHAPPIYTHAI